MGIETGLAVGGAVLGGLAGSQSKGGGTTTETRTPWSEQQPYLKYGFEQGRTATENALANPVYQGQRVAAMTPEQQALINQATGFAGGQFPTAQTIQNLGLGMVTPGAQFGQNAANIYGQVAGVDPTQQILANAAQYANNPYTQGIVDAASRDVSRNLLENQLPSLAMGATGTGNINSTRAGAQQAIAERGAAERLADISSNIRGQFFQTGLNQSQNQYNQNLQNQLAANEALRQSFGAGISGVQTGQQLGTGAFGLGSTAAAMPQAQQQAELNAQIQKFAEERGVPLDILKQYMGIVGGNYGGTATATAPSTGGGFMGALQGALGGGLGAMGLAPAFSGLGSGNNIENWTGYFGE